jgi:hypothetical protein
MNREWIHSLKLFEESSPDVQTKSFTITSMTDEIHFLLYL